MAPRVLSDLSESNAAIESRFGKGLWTRFSKGTINRPQARDEAQWEIHDARDRRPVWSWVWHPKSSTNAAYQGSNEATYSKQVDEGR